MKTYEKIANIIDSISEKALETIDNAWYEMILDQGRARRNARNRFLYNIKKIGITEEEYNLWKNI